MEPEVECRRTAHVVHFPLCVGKTIELIAELTSCLQHRRDRTQVAVAAVQTQKIEAQCFQRRDGIPELALRFITRAREL